MISYYICYLIYIYQVIHHKALLFTGSWQFVSIDIPQALKLAIQFYIYAYDAYFLQCAKSLSRPIFTLDKQMKQVASELNIEILE